MSENEMKSWIALRQMTPEKYALARLILEEVRAGEGLIEATRHHPLPKGGYLPKSMLIETYRDLIERGEWAIEPKVMASLRMKPVRTLSGVTTVTILTKPYPCPGQCIFCPTDARMPKSYLPDEPGAMRGLQNQFDPYKQVRSRLDALEAVGHPTDKIELLILGGTWSAYRKDYQEWFILRSFDALNGEESDTLEIAHQKNEMTAHRCVGLVVETRPDEVIGNHAADELAWLRRLGVTKVQMGAQSLDDRVLALNQRGHTSEQTRAAMTNLRAAGFKIVLHLMPNLLGATLESDRADFIRLWQDGFCPDEIKIYPCQLLESAELYHYWQRGEYTPYTQEELIQLIADMKMTIPPYCRVNRVIRDIPSGHVVEGNRRTSLRMDVLEELARRGQQCGCIRCREVRAEQVEIASLKLVDFVYRASASEEHFLQFVTSEDRIAGYLRLSLPMGDSPDFTNVLTDLQGAALIREVHVYGQSLAVGEEQAGAAQHSGLGTKLLQQVGEITRLHGFARLAVIAAIGTRLYYERRGFQRGQLYMYQEL